MFPDIFLKKPIKLIFLLSHFLFHMYWYRDNGLDHLKGQSGVLTDTSNSTSITLTNALREKKPINFNIN